MFRKGRCSAALRKRVLGSLVSATFLSTLSFGFLIRERGGRLDTLPGDLNLPVY